MIKPGQVKSMFRSGLITQQLLLTQITLSAQLYKNVIKLHKIFGDWVCNKILGYQLQILLGDITLHQISCIGP